MKSFTKQKGDRFTASMTCSGQWDEMRLGASLMACKSVWDKTGFEKQHWMLGINVSLLWYSFSFWVIL